MIPHNSVLGICRLGSMVWWRICCFMKIRNDNFLERSFSSVTLNHEMRAYHFNSFIYSPFTYYIPTIVSPLLYSPSHCPDHDPQPPSIPTSFLFRKAQTSNGHQPNRSYLVAIKLGTNLRIKVEWGNPIWGSNKLKLWNNRDTWKEYHMYGLVVG